jgi:hypothetical protein
MHYKMHSRTCLIIIYYDNLPVVAENINVFLTIITSFCRA